MDTRRAYIHIASSDSLVLEWDRAPTPGPGELLIDVAFAGINRADLFQRLGLYPPPADASPIPGLEVSGQVAAVGAGVVEFAVGDRVCALTHGGGYANKAIADRRHCLKLPEGVSLEAGAALPEALLTVWVNVFQRAGLSAGETLWVTGGSSGIGTLAIQMGRAAGARVLSTAGSDAKCDQLRQMGAEFVANYRDADVVEALTGAGYSGAIDVTLDMAGGATTAAAVELAAVDGRIVCIGVMASMTAELNLLSILGKRLTLTGSTLRRLDADAKARAFAALRETALPWVEAGTVRPLLAAVYPLAEAGTAHAAMERGEHTGKLLLDCRTLDTPGG